MKLWYTFLRDLKVSFRTFYIYIEIVMALIFVAVALFVVPEDYVPTVRTYVHVEESPMSSAVKERLEEEGGSIVFVDSRDALVGSLSSDRESSGVSVTFDGSKINYEVVLQGYEGDRVRNMVKASILSDYLEKMPGFESKAEIQVLDARSTKLSDRIGILPVFLLLNSGFVGLFVVAAYIFIDKDEGTIRALTVTPVRIRDYLISKMGVMMMTGIMTGLMTTILVAGKGANYPYLLLLLIGTNMFGTALGLLIASFYDNIINSMGSIFIVVFLLATATVSYYMPAFSPMAVKLLPSYPMLFAFKEVFLNQPDSSFVFMVAAGSAAAGILIFGAALYRFKKTLTVVGGVF